MSETATQYPSAADYAAVDAFWDDGEFTGFDSQDRENFARWRALARAEERSRCVAEERERCVAIVLRIRERERGMGGEAAAWREACLQIIGAINE